MYSINKNTRKHSIQDKHKVEILSLTLNLLKKSLNSDGQ